MKPIVTNARPAPSRRRGSTTFADVYGGTLGPTSQMAGTEGVAKVTKNPALDVLDDFVPGQPDFFAKTRAGGIALLAAVLAGLVILDEGKRR